MSPQDSRSVRGWQGPRLRVLAPFTALMRTHTGTPGLPSSTSHQQPSREQTGGSPARRACEGHGDLCPCHSLHRAPRVCRALGWRNSANKDEAGLRIRYVSVVRVPLTSPLPPSFLTWILVVTGPLLLAAFSLCSTQQPAGTQVTSVPLLRTFHWLPSHLEPSKRQSSSGMCEAPHVLAPHDHSAVSAAPPQVTVLKPLASVCHARASGPSGPSRFVWSLDTPPGGTLSPPPFSG